MNFNNFTIKAQEAVQQAIDLVQSKGQQVVETPHLFKGIITKGEEVTQFLFGKLGVNSSGPSVETLRQIHLLKLFLSMFFQFHCLMYRRHFSACASE